MNFKLKVSFKVKLLFNYKPKEQIYNKFTNKYKKQRPILVIMTIL